MSRSKMPPDPEAFAAEFERIGATEMARKYDVAVRNVFARRKKAEGVLGRPIYVPARLSKSNRPRKAVRQNLSIEKDMTILVGSDAHYEQNSVTTAGS